jgi:hypothetical protein
MGSTDDFKKTYKETVTLNSGKDQGCGVYVRKALESGFLSLFVTTTAAAARRKEPDSVKAVTRIRISGTFALPITQALRPPRMAGSARCADQMFNASNETTPMPKIRTTTAIGS